MITPLLVVLNHASTVWARLMSDHCGARNSELDAAVKVIDPSLSPGRAESVEWVRATPDVPW